MSSSVIDEVKERLDIVDVIGGYITLQKAGRSFKAVCPFHAEKTPSFFVFPDRGTWRCFGACATGGDVISFVQKKENLEFRDALELLARRAGVDIDRHRDPQAATLVNTLREINELASGFFQHQLLHTAAGAAARSYLDRRGVTAAATAQFRLGFAPESWDSLLNYLRGRSISPDLLETAGLIVRRDDGGFYDRFRDRLMIPICDLQGRVIGFGGRILSSGEPKYLNTPQTPLFDKSNVIFALDHARKAILAADQAVIVEGYMDVISAHQAGYGNVVAAMGTAVTPQHLQRLSRYTNQFVFALDADAAGMNATLRSLQTARETLANTSVPVPTARGGVRFETRLAANIKIAVMPQGQDPDDVLRQNPAEWNRLIAEATPLLDFTFTQAGAALDLKSAHGKAQLVRQLVPIISEIDDRVERRHYVSRLASLAGVTEREIDQDLETYARRSSRQRSAARDQQPPATQPASGQPVPTPSSHDGLPEEPPDAFGPPGPLPDAFPGSSASAAVRQPGRAQVRPTPTPGSDSTGLLEDHILAHILARPDLLSSVDNDLAEYQLDPINTEDFEQAANRAIFDAQQEFLYSDAAYTPADLTQRFDTVLHARIETLQGIILQFTGLRDEQRRKDLVDTVLRLRLSHLRKSCRDLELLMRSADLVDADQIDLGVRLGVSMQARRLVERALHARSHTSRWIQEQQRLNW